MARGLEPESRTYAGMGKGCTDLRSEVRPFPMEESEEHRLVVRVQHGDAREKVHVVPHVFGLVLVDDLVELLVRPPDKGARLLRRVLLIAMLLQRAQNVGVAGAVDEVSVRCRASKGLTEDLLEKRPPGLQRALLPRCPHFWGSGLDYLAARSLLSVWTSMN